MESLKYRRNDIRGECEAGVRHLVIGFEVIMKDELHHVRHI